MKKTLVIMGTHWKGLRDFDWSRKDCEIWMFNEAAHIKDPSGKLLYPHTDVVFQLHHEAIWRNPKNRSSKDHYNWLASGKTPPVYMQKHFPDVLKSIEYPIEDVLSLVKNVQMVVNGEEKIFKYFSSTPEYALALVAKMWKEGKCYSQVEVYGIELELESEYVYQRMGFGFWVGYLAGLGIPVKLHTSMFNEPMYGYEGDVAISSAEFEKRISDLLKELGEDREKYAQEANVFLESLSRLLKENASSEIEKELNEITKRNERAGILNGKLKEAGRYLEKAGVMEAASGAAVFSPGEFDESRNSYQKQYSEVRAEATILNAKIAEHLKRLLILKKGSRKRQKALDVFGNMVAELMNKNMLMLHIVGGMQENQYYLDSYKQSVRLAGERD